MHQNMTISRSDLEQLQKEPSAKMRATIAEKISTDFVARRYNQGEEQIALEIFRVLSHDAEVVVRKVLSQQLADCIDLPRDIALKLAYDVEEVSVPFVQHTVSLSEDDLIEIIVSSKKLAVLNAIASRQSLSQEVASALLFRGDATVIKSLAANKGASIHEDDMLAMLKKPEVTRDESVLESLVERGGLSVTVAEKLFSVVSDALKQQLTEKYKLNVHVAEDTVRSARELATIGITTSSSRAVDIEKLVEQLHTKKRLTFSIILRALCNGDLRFFEAAMARLANVPSINARILVLDPGPLGFKSLYQSTPMPAGFLAATKVILDIVLEETAWGRVTKSDIRQRVVERVNESGLMDQIDNLDYMVALLGRTDPHVATLH